VTNTLQNSLRQIVYKQSSQARFSVIDPNQSGNDITGGSANTRTIQTAFSAAYRELKQRMAELDAMSIQDRRGKSILEVIIGGNYSSFEVQRDHLWKCHQALTR
jgi:non-canonical poly(A) RNA polymerase PAPD5/7